MIYYLCRQEHRGTVGRLLRRQRASLGSVLQVLAYEDLFIARAIPAGHLLFTDLDRLTVYETETAATIARAQEAALPGVQILNRPESVLLRYRMLRVYRRAGLNSFDVQRLEDADPSSLSYPVFIRREDEALGPESVLLDDAAALEAAITDLPRRGLPLRGRLVVEFRNAPGADGRFRKYAAFKIGERILPHHLQINEDWVVKRNGKIDRDADAAEEFAFVRDNPHEAALRRAFALARIDFGRIDYAVVDGRVEVFEINTNPTFGGGLSGGVRGERSQLVRERMIEALRTLDTPLPAHGLTRFDRPVPRVHRLPGPRNPLKALLFFKRFAARRPASASPTGTAG